MMVDTLMVDYYKELGLHRHATAPDIRAAYKRLALIWHPDRNKDQDAEEKFKKIKKAYDVLSDETQRREYDKQKSAASQSKQNSRFETTTVHANYAPTKKNPFNLQTFDKFMSSPIDPFDILDDIQHFQDADFAYNMMNSPSYRNLYTFLFDSMNNNPDNNPHILPATPIFLNNDRLFRPNAHTRSKHLHQPNLHHRRHQPQQHNPYRNYGHAPSKYSTAPHVPVIHSTMANDWFLNEIIDLYEQQNHAHNQSSYSPFYNDPFFNELNHCTNCQKKISTNRTRLMQHEQQCRQNTIRYTNRTSNIVRV